MVLFAVMDQRRIVTTVESLVQPLLEGEGLALVDVDFQRETSGWVLRLYIEKRGGVSLEDCIKVSKEFGQLLDVEDVIPGPYTLEVSSPGLDRPLRREEDFVRFVGEKVRIRTEDYIGGQRNFRGELVECHGGTIRVKMEEEKEVEIPLSSIRKAKLDIGPHKNR